jgi:hypothetical protein
MLVEIFEIHVPIFISLIVILVCLGTSVIYSITVAGREERKQVINKGDVDLH